MVFTKFVQVGRAVKINYGPNEGKLATIVEIVNEKRVLVDGPNTGVQRQVIPIRRLTLTKFHVSNVLRGQRSCLLKKKIEKFDLVKKYEATGAARKAQRKARRAQLTDFDRFRVQVLRKRRANLLGKQVRVLSKQGKAQAPAAAKGGNKKK